MPAVHYDQILCGLTAFMLTLQKPVESGSIGEFSSSDTPPFPAPFVARPPTASLFGSQIANELIASKRKDLGYTLDSPS